MANKPRRPHGPCRTGMSAPGHGIGRHPALGEPSNKEAWGGAPGTAGRRNEHVVSSPAVRSVIHGIRPPTEPRRSSNNWITVCTLTSHLTLACGVRLGDRARLAALPQEGLGEKAWQDRCEPAPCACGTRVGDLSAAPPDRRLGSSPAASALFAGRGRAWRSRAACATRRWSGSAPFRRQPRRCSCPRSRPSDRCRWIGSLVPARPAGSTSTARPRRARLIVH